MGMFVANYEGFTYSCVAVRLKHLRAVGRNEGLATHHPIPGHESNHCRTPYSQARGRPPPTGTSFIISTSSKGNPACDIISLLRVQLHVILAGEALKALSARTLLWQHDVRCGC